MVINQQTRRMSDDDTSEEIIGILTAISIVSKRLAKKLRLLEQDAEEGGNQDEQDEHT